MKEMQAFSKEFVKYMNWEIDDESYEKSRASLLNNYMLLTTEVGEVAEELRTMFNLTNKDIQNGISEEEAFQHAIENVKDNLGKEMADCIAYLMKIANFFEIDLENAYYKKMEEVKKRKNKDVRYIK
ncbi:MazG nucleotide pyrophosphohydrolase domain-containing protein [Salirhabdus salicampi]|uniref:MazG nucleotide pyrophosphohydrolase domain-containing protein n=1 Tax=Salirhabdus salicampi TaxID=476102 RepID=UPI0020C363A8|nr:MazG nucleotide pyrophosphohydrolase domain-containing protein [Salirhabdus salicampi]MCP8615884.1 hypothetical protein [Salirhabdus salicampi]